MDNRSPRPAAPSLAALLGGIMHDAKDLLVQELTLAKLEGHEELGQIKTAVLLLGIGIGVGAVGGILLSMMLVHVLAAYTDMPLWGCYGIVGSVFGRPWLGAARFGQTQSRGNRRDASDRGDHEGERAMAQRADDIRHDIEDTRAAMTAKLAIVEERILETVTGAQASVEKIMEDVGTIVTDVGVLWRISGLS